MQRRMNYSAKFSNNNNSEYVSPAKKARKDFFQSRPSTLRMQQRTSSSPIVDANSVFKVLVNDFPPEVTQALDKTASVGGTNDGVFSWAIKGGQLHVWNNLTKQTIAVPRRTTPPQSESVWTWAWCAGLKQYCIDAVQLCRIAECSTRPVRLVHDQVFC